MLVATFFILRDIFVNMTRKLTAVSADAALGSYDNGDYKDDIVNEDDQDNNRQVSIKLWASGRLILNLCIKLILAATPPYYKTQLLN